MEHLRICAINSTSFPVLFKPKHCVLVDSDRIYTTDGKSIFLVKKDPRCLCSLPQDITALEYSVSGEQLIVCDEEGGLWTVSTENGEAVSVGCIEAGIAVGALSPTEERFVLITKNYNVIVFSQDLDALAETPLDSSQGVELVSVGWGSEQTQFKGSKRAEKSGNIADDSYDDGLTRISWRGDGEYFAVSYSKDGERRLQVLDKEGVVLHTTKPTQGINSILSWKPNGFTIAVTRRLRGGNFICFFEKNLLERDSFQVDCDAISNILWNSDSTYLAVLTESSILIYTQKNWHWYNKYSIPNVDFGKVLDVSWDCNVPLMLNVLTKSDGSITYKSWRWNRCVDTSSGASADDEAMVAVIDGPKLCLTAFKQAVIPPPMASFELTLDNNINSCGFLMLGAETDSASSNSLFIQTCKGTIEIYHYDVTDNRYTLAATGFCDDYELFQISWVYPDCFLACAMDKKGNHHLAKFEIEKTQLEIVTKPLVSPILALRRNGSAIAAWDFENCYQISKDTLEIENTRRLPGRGLLVNAEVRDGTSITLDNSHSLYVNDQLISKNIISFRSSESFLLATSLQHKLLCWPLTNLEGVSERQVERGSRIVTVIPRTSNVVLELPRGNLEVVRPRALTVASLKEFLDNLDYSAAFVIMRRDRINLNLLHDHNPQAFQSNVARFADEIGEPSRLCSFVADLTNEDVTQTIYAQFYSPSNQQTEKINRLCSLLQAEFESRGGNFFLPVLSCLVKKDDAATALLKIQALLKESDPNKSRQAEEGLIHVLYFKSADELLKAALGTYDLELATFVISKSQMDPKEHLPFISDLKKLDENYRKFRIDNHLRRYELALGHLCKCENKTEECLVFVQRHQLFKEALKLFPQDSPIWKNICTDFATHLTSKNRHEEAGLLLQRAGQWQLASHAFSRSGSWLLEINCLKKITGLSNDDLTKSINTIAEKLTAVGRQAEAAEVFVDHLGDIQSGVDALCCAQLFDKAIHKALMHDRTDLVSSIIKTQAVGAAENWTRQIREGLDGLEQHLARLKEMREEVSGKEIDWDDTGSEFSTSSRGSSRLSSRSAKNARKLERNLLKRGGPFEVLGITAAIHDGVSKLASMMGQVRAVNVSLISLNESGVASQLQTHLAATVDRCQEIVKQIWPEGVNKGLGITFDREFPAPVRSILSKVLFPPSVSNWTDWLLESL